MTPVRWPAHLQNPALQVGLGIVMGVLALWIWGLFTWDGALPGNDDMMRLAQVRDLLAGQGWWDVNQYRFDTPEGGAMHWSRVPDLLIGALIALMTPFVGAESAEMIVLATWPRLILAGVLAAIAVSLHRLGASRAGIAAGLVAFLLSHAAVQFQPGRIDHHGFELMAVLAAFAALCGPGRSWRTGVFVAACIALMLTVAIESLPYAAGLLVLCGLAWVHRGEAEAGLMKGLGAGLMAFCTLFYVVDAPGPGAARAVCDAYGNFHASALIVSGAGLFALAWAGQRLSDWRGRLTAGAGLATAATLTALAVDPSCLGSPYSGVDAAVMQGWMASVTEARNIATLFATSPGFAIAVFGFALAGLVAGGVSLHEESGETRSMLIGLVALTALATLVTAWQVRAVVFAHGFAAICVGWAAHHLFNRLKAETGTVRVASLAAMLALSPTTWQTVGTQFAPAAKEASASAEARQDCRAPASKAELQAIPPARVFAPIDLGTALLVHTEHTVFAAPYHRNPGAIERAIHVFESEPQTARMLLQEAGADYLYVCEDLGEMRLYARRAPEGLAAALQAGELPEWLHADSAATTDTGARILRVRQDTIAKTALP